MILTSIAWHDTFVRVEYLMDAATYVAAYLVTGSESLYDTFRLSMHFNSSGVVDWHELFCSAVHLSLKCNAIWLIILPLCYCRWRSHLMWRVFFTSAVVAVVVRSAMNWCKSGKCGHFGSGGFIIWDISG